MAARTCLLTAFLLASPAGATSAPWLDSDEGHDSKRAAVLLSDAVPEWHDSLSGNQTNVSHAPLFDFYLYRAQSGADYPIGNVNVGNLPGVMWYLTNEVAAYSTPCKPRYNITRIRRIRVQTRATNALFKKGMNFGVRYSYDAGKCTGSNIRSLGPCTLTWTNYGYVPGCNNFRDHYPYPLDDTAYPEGVWYSFPSEGRCKAPTGSWKCTWSYQEAGDIRIADLEANEPGHEHCCNGNCTGFWSWPYDRSRGAWRVQQAFKRFAEKYPDQPADLPAPPCDFNRAKFWAPAR